MMLDREMLMQEAARLAERAEHDVAALGPLCEVYSALGDMDASMEALRRLMQHEESPAQKAFDEIYLQALPATQSRPGPLRRRRRLTHLVELLERTTALAGDVAECGCFRGLSSFVMCSFLQRWDPSFDGTGYHVFDSFQGLSEPTTEDEIPAGWKNERGLRAMTHRGAFKASLAEVKGNLSKFPGIDYCPGWIPLVFQKVPERKYRFVHVDVDLYDPTLDCFSYFYPRLSPGGYIVSDDYSWPGASRAIDEFAAENGLTLVVTEFKQAVIRKPD